MDTNRIIKGHTLEFGEFPQFIVIWLFITVNPGKNQVEYFSETLIDISGNLYLFVNQYMSGNHFECICSSLRFTLNPPYPLLPFDINDLKFDR